MRIPALLFLLSLFAPVSFAQANKAIDTPTISLGEKTLTLGMPKDQVIAMLAADYLVKPLNEAQWQWSVESKPPYTRATPYSVIGGVAFDSDKLVYVSKRLYNADRNVTGPEFARGFQAAVAQFVKDSNPDFVVSIIDVPAASCFIWTGATDSPESEDKAILMQCGARLLNMVWHHASGNAVLTDRYSNNGNVVTERETEGVALDETIGGRVDLQPKK